MFTSLLGNNGNFHFSEAFNFFPMFGTGFSWSFTWPPTRAQNNQQARNIPQGMCDRCVTDCVYDWLYVCVAGVCDWLYVCVTDCMCNLLYLWLYLLLHLWVTDCICLWLIVSVCDCAPIENPQLTLKFLLHTTKMSLSKSYCSPVSWSYWASLCSCTSFCNKKQHVTQQWPLYSSNSVTQWYNRTSHSAQK